MIDRHTAARWIVALFVCASWLSLLAKIAKTPMALVVVVPLAFALVWALNNFEERP